VLLQGQEYKPAVGCDDNNTRKREKNCPSSNNKINCNQRSLFFQECQRSSLLDYTRKKKLLFILQSPHKRKAYLPPKPKSDSFFVVGFPIPWDNRLKSYL
jgi:hypothetical protein